MASAGLGNQDLYLSNHVEVKRKHANVAMATTSSVEWQVAWKGSSTASDGHNQSRRAGTHTSIINVHHTIRLI